MRANMQHNTRRTVAQILKVGADSDPKDCFNIITMADLLAKPLRSSEFRFWETEEQQAKWQKSQREDPLTRTSAAAGQGKSVLIRYTKNGEFNNSKGKAYQRYCYICRTYGSTCNTQWVCRACGMPLCKKGPRGKLSSCTEEHFNPQKLNDGCFDRRGDAFIVPPESIKNNEDMMGIGEKDNANNNGKDGHSNNSYDDRIHDTDSGDDSDEEESEVQVSEQMEKDKGKKRNTSSQVATRSSRKPVPKRAASARAKLPTRAASARAKRNR